MGENPLQSTSSAVQAKVYRNTKQDYTLSLIYLYMLYSVEAILQWQTLNCTQIQTGILIRVVIPKYRTQY
jgi:hypothetical protein